MRSENVVGIEGIDTRALTKIIREKGTMLGKIVLEDDIPDDVEMVDPNTMNLVAEVSTNNLTTYNQGGSPRILAVDCGLKRNQIRCLVSRGAQVAVVPWNHSLDIDMTNYDGLFLSNGPGDPQTCEATINNLKKVLTASQVKPVFGICLGHQLISAAAGCNTYKLK